MSTAALLDDLEVEFWESLCPREILPVDEWIPENCVLTEGPRPGPFEFKRGFCWQRDIAIALGEEPPPGHGKRECVICKPCQVGITTLILAVAAYRAVAIRKPVLVLEPRDSDANRAAGEFQRMVQGSKPLKGEFPARDARKLRWTKNGIKIFFKYSNSDVELTGFSSQANYHDEDDRLYRGEDFSAPEMAVKRQAAWPDSIVAHVSTPTVPGFGVDLLYASSDQRRRWVPCPHCDAWQVMTFERNASWDKTQGTIKLQAASAYVHCSECRRPWSRNDREVADARGEWRAEHPERKLIGFHIEGIAVSTRNVSDLVEAHLKGKTSEQARKEHLNQDRALPYLPRGAKLPESAISDCIRPRVQWGAVPVGTRRLVCGVDVQRSMEPLDFVYEVRAYDEMEIATVISYGIVSGREAIADILRRDWGGMRIGKALMDAGDGAHHSRVVKALAKDIPCLSPAIFDQHMAKGIDDERHRKAKGGFLYRVSREHALTDCMGRFYPGEDGPTIRIAKNPDEFKEREWISQYRGLHRREVITNDGPRYEWVKLRQDGVDYPFAGGLCEIARGLTQWGGRADFFMAPKESRPSGQRKMQRGWGGIKNPRRTGALRWDI